MPTPRDKGRTGLEWLLDEARKPDAPKDSERAPRPDPVEAALAALGPAEPEKPEAWEVVPLQPVPEEEAAGPGATVKAAALPSRESMRNNSLDATLRAETPVAPAEKKDEKKAEPAVEKKIAPEPAPAKARDLRTQPRAVIVFEARYKKGSEAIVGHGRNVSRAGMFVETKKFLPDGEVFQLQLVFAEPNSRRLSVIAEVIWASLGDPEDLARHPPGMGLKFLDVDDKDVPFLVSLLPAKKSG